MCIRDRMEVDGIAETSGFVENIGLRPNIPGRNFNKNYFFVADNVAHTHTHLSLIHICLNSFTVVTRRNINKLS